MSLTFLADNQVIDAAIEMVVGTENAQFPLTNIQHDFTTKVFRSNENTVEILFTLPATMTIDSFAIVGSSSTGMGVTDVTIQGSGSTNFAGATAITVDINAEYNFGFKLFTPSGAYKYWKLTVTGAGDYVELSNIYLGVKTQLTTNGFATSSFSHTSQENASIQRNKYGQRFIDVYNTTSGMTGEIQHVNGAEFDDIDGVFVMHGTTIPLWVIADPSGAIATDSEFLYSGYFYLTEAASWTMSGPLIYNTSITLSEAT